MTVSSLPGSTSSDAVRSVVQGDFPRTVADLSRLVATPSVAWPAFDPAHVHRSAEQVADLLRDLDVFESVIISQAPADDSGNLGMPAVLATRAARAGRPTVVLYAHHDVQPPGDDADWLSPPYEATVRDGRLYGRGAADDKAGIMAHIASIRALVDTVGGDFDLGLTVFIEGEEEAGSPSFAAFLEQHRAELAGDVIVVADSANWAVDVPALTVSLRGNVTGTVEVRTLEHASHSGMFGGAVPDALMAAARLIASFHTDSGDVAIDGLRAAHCDAPDYPLDQLRAETGLLADAIGSGSVPEKLWVKPAVTVTGVDAPTVANASNTLIPMVRFQVSVRTAPDQDPHDAAAALRAHLARHAPFGAEVSLSDVDLGSGFLVDTSGWAVAEVKQAMADAWGVAPVEMGIGGSIPFIADLVRVFPAAQILVTGVEDPDSRAHSPNESLHLGVLLRAVLTETLLLVRLNDRVVAEGAPDVGEEA